MGHLIKFEKAKVLASDQGYHQRIAWEAIEIVKNHENFNWVNGLKLLRMWKPLITVRAQLLLARFRT